MIIITSKVNGAVVAVVPDYASAYKFCQKVNKSKVRVTRYTDGDLYEYSVDDSGIYYLDLDYSEQNFDKYDRVYVYEDL